MTTHYAPLGRLGMVLCGLRIAAYAAFRGVPKERPGTCRTCARYVLRYTIASEGTILPIRFWPVQVTA